MMNTTRRIALGVMSLLFVGCSREIPSGPTIPEMTPPIEFNEFGYFDGGSGGWLFRDSKGSEIQIFCAHSSDDPGFEHPEGVVPGGYYLVTDLDGIGIGDLDDTRLIPIPSIAARRIAGVAESILQNHNCRYPLNRDEEIDVDRLVKWELDLQKEHGETLGTELRNLAVLEHILQSE